MTLSADIKGEVDEGLLERNAQDTKSGAGQCNRWCGSVP